MANGHRSRTRRIAATRSDAEIRALLTWTLDHTLKVAGATQRDAARWMRVSETTVNRWLAGRGTVNVLAVLRSRRLALPFVHRLCREIAVRDRSRA